MHTIVTQATGAQNASQQLKAGRSHQSPQSAGSHQSPQSAATPNGSKREKCFGSEVDAEDTGLWKLLCEVPLDIECIVEYIRTTEFPETNVRDTTFGWYPLLIAASAGQPGLLKLLLNSKAKPDVVCYKGNSALILAARNGHLGAVEFLLSRKVDLNTKSTQGWSALHWSCINGNEDIATSLLVAAADFNLEDNDGRTACMWAARHGYVEIVEALLVCGINLGAQDHAGLTAMDHAREHMNLRTVIAAAEEVNRDLLEAARRADNHAMKIAIQRGADISIHDENGWSPLMWSALHGTFDLVTLLVSHGANPSLVAEGGDHIGKLGDQHLAICDSLRSVLGANERMLSMAKEQRWDEVESCLKIGAWVNVRDKDRRTVLMWAARHGASTAISMLVNKGAHIDERDIFGWTATLFAVWSKSMEATAMLYYLSADFTIRSFEGDSLLHVAVRANDSAMVQLLLAAKSDLEEQDVDGYSPLMLSASTGLGQATSTLLAWGASINMADHHNRNAFMLAVLNGHISVAQMMLDPLQAPPAIPKPREKKIAKKSDGDTNSSRSSPKKADSKVLFSEKASEPKRAGAKAKAKLKDMNIPRATRCESSATLIQMAGQQRAEVIDKLPKINTKILLKETDKDGRAPLHLAVIHKDVDMIQMLISRASDITASDLLGNTVLHEAALRNQEQVVSILLEVACNITIKNKAKSLPIDLTEDLNIKGMLQRTAVIRALPVASVADEGKEKRGKVARSKEPPVFRARVEGLPTHVAGDAIEDRLRDLIKRLGAPSPVKLDIAVDPITSRPLGYASIDFNAAAELDLTIRGDGAVMEGDTIRIFKDMIASKKRS